MALVFNGNTSNYVEKSVTFSANTGTICAWIYLPSNPAIYQSIFLMNGVDNEQVNLYFGATGNELRIYSGVSNTSAGGSTLSTGQWYHIAMTWNGTSLLAYLNGVLDVTLTGSGATWNLIRLGFDLSYWGDSLVGYMSDVVVWDSTLTQIQIQQQMYRKTPIDFSNIIAWLPTLPGVDERNRDYSGLGNSLTVVGTITDADNPPISWGSPLRLEPYFSSATSITPTDITCGTPTVDSVAIAQKHTLTLAAITTANSQVQDLTFIQNHALTATAITTGNPTLDTTTVFEGISAASIITGAPSIDTLAVVQQHLLSTATVSSGFSDSFTAANATLLTAYSASWVNNFGSFVINTNRLYANAGSQISLAHWGANSFNADQFAQATVKTIGANGAMGVAVRCDASASSGYIFYGDAYYLYLFKYVAGSFTLIDQLAYTIAVNDVLRLEVVGTTLTPKVNGTTWSLGPKTDASLSAGYPGVGGSKGASTDWSIDDWTGGDNSTVSGIVTGAPSVGIATLSIIQTLTADNITLGAPSVPSVVLDPDPFFVAATTNSSSAGSTTISVTTPTHIDGDLIVVAFAWELSNASVTPVQSGWNSLWNTSNGARTHTQAAYWRRAGASEPGSYSFTITSAEWVIAAISIRNASNPYANSAQFNNSSSTSATAPTVTTTRGNDLVVYTGSNMYGATWTSPTNFTEHADVRSSTAANNISLTIATRLLPTAGSSGTLTGTSNNADYNAAGSFAVTKKAITQDLTANAITTGNPTPENAVLHVNHQLAFSDITTSQPTVEALAFVQNFVFTVPDITTGNPVVGNLTLSGILELVAIAPSIGPPTVDNLTMFQVHALTCPDVTTGTPTLETLQISQNTAITPIAITCGTPNVDNATISELNLLSTGELETAAPIVDSVAITQVHNVVFDDVMAGTPTFENPSLSENYLLACTGITTSAVNIETPALSQVHVVVLAGITTEEPVVDALAMNGATALVPVSILTGAPSVGTLVLSQAHVLTAQDTVSGAPSVASVSMAQAHALACPNVTTGSPTVNDTTLSQVHLLVAVSIVSQAPVVGSASMTPTVEVFPLGITTGTPELQPAPWNQNHILGCVDITSANPTVESATAAIKSNLVLDNITTGNVQLESPDWTLGKVFSANNILAGEYFLPNPVLSQNSALAPNDITTGTPVVGSPYLGIGNTLVPENITTGAPELGSLQVQIKSALTVQGITTGAPSVAQILILQQHYLFASTIVTSEPTIGSPTINPGERTPGRHTFSTKRTGAKYDVRTFAKQYDVK